MQQPLSLIFYALLQLPLFFLQFPLQGAVDLPRLLPDGGQILFDDRVLLQFLPDEHQRKADQQKAAGDPDGSAAQLRRAFTAQPSPQREQQDDAEVTHHPILAWGSWDLRQMQKASTPLRRSPMHMVLAKA